MAPPALSATGPAALPAEAELQSFARAAALLLAERQPRASGAPALTRRAGVGLQHIDHRDYMPGDEVRHIDWRQTARARRPILRRFEAESASDWCLLLDASSSMASGDGAKWRCAVQATAALGYALLQLGHRVGVVVFGTQVLAECPRGRGRHHYAAIARLLAAQAPRVQGERSALGSCARRVAGAAAVMAISDFLAADQLRADLSLLRLHCRELHVLQLADEADERLAEAGELELVDQETSARLQARADAAADAAAAAARAAMTARLRGFCAQGGTAFTDWNVRQAWQHALLRHLVEARSHC